MAVPRWDESDQPSGAWQFRKFAYNVLGRISRNPFTEGFLAIRPVGKPIRYASPRIEAKSLRSRTREIVPAKPNCKIDR